MWLGHFDLWTDEGLPMFRHAIPLRGTTGLMPEQLNDLVEVAISESERFYPAFQYVVVGRQDAPRRADRLDPRRRSAKPER